MGKFEQYLEQFSQSISLIDFLIGIAVAAPLLIFLRLFYIRFGHAVSNRSRFANNFLPLGLTTMLIITIVQSSIALSLGLVGALSIVRFRAAIKDPEELVYLFLVIAIGLGCGAGQPILSLIAFILILGMIFVNNRLSGQKAFKQHDNMYLNIRTDMEDVHALTELFSKHLSYVELKRMDQIDGGLDLSYIIKSDSLKQLEEVRRVINGISPKSTLSFVDQPNLGI
jgi:uncharacterized membrane protein YhiD involved in acid resistance